MREILFRGKNARNNEWYFGFLGKDIYHGEEYYKIYEVNDIYDDGLHIKDNFINCGDVIPDTIGQFTGLYDKNGVKIFEGDIVSYSVTNYDGSIEHRIGEIIYKGSRFYVCAKKKLMNLDFLIKGLNQNVYKLEVIGNIYDNFELLEDN